MFRSFVCFLCVLIPSFVAVLDFGALLVEPSFVTTAIFFASLTVLYYGYNIYIEGTTLIAMEKVSKEGR